jgi:opacity protein-like surface antigen
MNWRTSVAKSVLVTMLIAQAGSAQETAMPPQPPPEAIYAGPRQWTGHLNYVIGYKQLASTWRPARDQVEVGLLDFDFRHVSWPASLAAQLLLSYDDTIPNQPGFLGNQSGTYEFNLGVRKVWDADQALQPFIGGGMAVAGGSTSTFLDFGWGESATINEDSDTSVGYWVGGGCYWLLNRAFHLGVNLQYSHADIELFGKRLDAGGFHVLLMLGYHW